MNVVKCAVSEKRLRSTGIEIKSTSAVATGKISNFVLQAGKSQTKKLVQLLTKFVCIKKEDNFGDIYFPPPYHHTHPVFYCQAWTRNESFSSYCNKFCELEIFLIFLWFVRGCPDTLNMPLLKEECFYGVQHKSVLLKIVTFVIQVKYKQSQNNFLFQTFQTNLAHL